MAASMFRYRVYTCRVRKMLYLGGVLQDRTHSVIWSYITGLLVILMCFSQCIFVINFCRDHTDNLVLLSRCFGMTCSFIAPVLMVSHAHKKYPCRKHSLQILSYITLMKRSLIKFRKFFIF